MIHKVLSANHQAVCPDFPVRRERFSTYREKHPEFRMYQTTCREKFAFHP
jgi:hypothetical protein